MSAPYATLEDLEHELGHEPGDDAERLLEKAQRLVDAALLGRTWSTDDNGDATDAGQADALRDAVCAQVAYWRQTADSESADPDSSRTARARLAPEANDALVRGGFWNGILAI